MRLLFWHKQTFEVTKYFIHRYRSRTRVKTSRSAEWSAIEHFKRCLKENKIEPANDGRLKVVGDCGRIFVFERQKKLFKTHYTLITFFWSNKVFKKKNFAHVGQR